MKSDQYICANKYYFIVFSDDWGEHPSSCQHLFKIIGKEYRVLWVNTIGMRNMRLTMADLKKALRKVGKMFKSRSAEKKRSDQVALKVDVIQPVMLPFVKNRFIRKVNALSVVTSIRRKSKEYKGLVPMVVTTVPNSCDYVDKLGAEKIMYYCVDDFSEWPGLEHDLVRQMESDLITKADSFVATSSKLYEKLATTGKPTELLTHGVDVDHFSNLPDEEHSLLKNIPKPRVGYFGLFDERSDQELILQVARKLPEISFVITGNVVVDVSKLEKQENIFFTGSVSYEELPAIIAGWEACMLPYVLNELTESISPLKLKEYLATGKAILSTSLPEVTKIDPNIYILDDPEEWVAFLMNYRARKNFKAMEYFENESWNKKAEEIIEILKGDIV